MFGGPRGFFLVLAALPSLAGSRPAEEPGHAFVGATFSQDFAELGTLTAEVTGFTPPGPPPIDASVADIETKGLYKVLYSDGDHAQLYFEELLRHGATLAHGPAGATTQDEL